MSLKIVDGDGQNNAMAILLMNLASDSRYCVAYFSENKASSRRFINVLCQAQKMFWKLKFDIFLNFKA